MNLSISVCEGLLELYTNNTCPIHGCPIHAQVLLNGRAHVACDAGHEMDLVQVIAVALDCTITEACERINKRFPHPVMSHPGFPWLTEMSVFPVEEPLPPIDTTKVDYWLSRNLSQEAIHAFGAGEVAGLPSLPVYDPLGGLVGIIQRYPDVPETDTSLLTGVSKYNNLGAVRKYLFGQPQARALNLPFRVVVEGPVDAMRVWEAGVPAVAINLNTMRLSQIQQLLCETVNLVWALDADTFGEVFEASAHFKLYIKPYFNIKKLALAPGTDPANYTPQELREKILALGYRL